MTFIALKNILLKLDFEFFTKSEAEPESDPSVSGQTGHQFDYRMMHSLNAERVAMTAEMLIISNPPKILWNPNCRYCPNSGVSTKQKAIDPTFSAPL
jgi:hypothetical protein